MPGWSPLANEGNESNVTDTEVKIIEEAKAEVRRKLAEEEAHWLVTRLGLAAVEYPEIVRRTLAVAFKKDFDILREEITALGKAVKEINERLDNAGRLVKAIDERTRPKQQGARPTR
jgi:hypothetical protein